MKTILITAYAINPYKGSEDGMGWNFVLQAARFNKIIAVTRRNNGPHIEKYSKAHPELAPQLNKIQFLYFDWPRWMIWWKKGPLLSLVYYYMWQFTLACRLLMKNLPADIVHNLNFHNDWTPSFLWLLRKPLVWGPVGHHPRIPKNFIHPIYGKNEYRKDKFLWLLKNIFWKLDPFLKVTIRRAEKVLCMNSHTAGMLKLPPDKVIIVPSVASEEIVPYPKQSTDVFTVISAGRFVPLKGFDCTIRAFSAFYNKLSLWQQSAIRLKLIGSGPCLPILKTIIEEENIQHVVEIIEWIPRQALQEMYASANVFLFPSHEGAGMVVAEAMSYGLPVVCLNNAGPGEFIHPQSRLKVAVSTYARTIYDLSEKLNDLYSDEYYYQQEKELSLQRFNTHFRWAVRGEQLKNIYDQMTIGSTDPEITVSLR